MLTASPDLRRYLTGFASSFGFVYTDAQESVFFTDPRYAEGARAALKNAGGSRDKKTRRHDPCLRV